MPQKRLDNPHFLRAYVPEAVMTKVNLELYSDLEGRVPYRAMTNLVTELLTEWLRKRGVMI